MAFVAFLDACVLYQVRWSPDVLAEMVRNLADRPGVDPPRALAGAEYARDTMERAFPDASVELAAYEPLIAAMTNDPKDRHV